MLSSLLMLLSPITRLYNAVFVAVVAAEAAAKPEPFVAFALVVVVVFVLACYKFLSRLKTSTVST